MTACVMSSRVEHHGTHHKKHYHARYVFLSLSHYGSIIIPEMCFAYRVTLASSGPTYTLSS